MNKQKALEILGRAIEIYEDVLSCRDEEDDVLHEILLLEFDMTHGEYEYVLKYNSELAQRKTLSQSLGGAEFISDDEENE